ncbi:unnamed protein product, partial [Closterium sp. NIES-54]
HAVMTAVLRCKAVDSPSALLPPSTFIAPWEQQLLLALLRALPSAAPHTQLAVLQDLLLLLSLNPANTRLLTHSPEWPEWLLEILLSNLEALPSAGTNQLTATQGQLGGQDKEKESSDLASTEGDGTGDSRAVRSSTSVQEDVNELIFSFLGIVFEHCLTVTQGWKVLEATFHCLQWKALIGGSSVGEQLKRLLHEALDFTASHLPANPPPPPNPAQPHSLSSPPPSSSALDMLSPRSSTTPATAALPTTASPAAAAPTAAAPSAAVPPVAATCLLENAVALLMLLEEFLRIQAEKRIIMGEGEEEEEGEEESGDGLVEGQRVDRDGVRWTVVAEEEEDGEGQRKHRPAAWADPADAALTAAAASAAGVGGAASADAATAAGATTAGISAEATAAADGATTKGTGGIEAAAAATPAWTPEFPSLDPESSNQTDPPTADATAATADSPATAAVDSASNGFGWVAEFPLIDLSAETLPATAVTVTVTTSAAAPTSSPVAGAAVHESLSAPAAVPAAAAAGMHFDLLTGSFSPSNPPLHPTVSPPLAPLSSPPGSASLISLDSPQQERQERRLQTHASPSGLGYGSIVQSLPDSWRRRSRLWFGEGVGKEGEEAVGWGGEGGGKGGKGGEAGGSEEGSRAEVSALEQVLLELADPIEEDEEEDEAGGWVDLRLVLKGVTILKGMLLEKEGVGAAESGVLAVLGGVGAGMSEALKEILDDDQSLVTILRVVLVAARETDGGEMGGELIRKGVREGEEVTEKVLSSLLWR